MTYSAIELIETKRDGGALPPGAIRWVIEAYTAGEVPDYQMSALAMAILLKGMTDDELAVWTEAMLHSGDVMDFSDLPTPKIDKHSTGGVGDKISIPLAPLVAACGVSVPMMSGRALGHTGGTLDKLESIPGFTTELDAYGYRRLLVEHGMVFAGQSKTMVPADRKLYALRDVSGTVPSIPLITSSILSKKLAEGLDGLLLDVKTGSGAFMQDLELSRQLAQTMVRIGTAHGVETVAYITSMEQPLGAEVGNANEIRESIEVLQGGGPDDVRELVLTFGGVMLDLAGVEGGRERLLDTIESGKALAKFKEVTIAQGGDPGVIHDPSLLATAPHTATLTSPSRGFVTGCDARAIGVAATRLGAGREVKKDNIDPGVGITVKAKIGDSVAAGDPLAVVRFSDESKWEAQKDHLASAWSVSDHAVAPPPLIIERVDRARI